MRAETVTLFVGAGLMLVACGKDSSRQVSANTPNPAIPPAVSQPVAPDAPRPQNLSKNMASGTVVPVQLRSVLDSSTMGADFVAGTISDDVKGTDGKVALPAGSTVTIYVRGMGKKGPVSQINLGLYSVNVMGRQYSLSTGPKDAATLLLTEDSGRGPGHASVHLYYGYRLDFKLDTPVELR